MIHHEVPDDPGTLRARGDVGEPGAEREASDHAEHAHDGAHQRGTHGNRAPSPAGRMQVVLRQAYHPLWNAPGCDTYSSMRGNLIVDCPASRVREGSIELDFRDATSDFAARISTTTWKSWLLATASMMFLWFVIGIRGRIPAADVVRL